VCRAAARPRDLAQSRVELLLPGAVDQLDPIAIRMTYISELRPPRKSGLDRGC
jgi:hypothetical protein